MEESSKDERFFVKRIHELSSAAYSRNIFTYSDFLDQMQISILIKETGELDTPFSLYGGYDEAERCIAAFKGRELYEGEDLDYPMVFIRIEPIGEKFTDGFGHRDILGSILGLGIERRSVGDIITNPFYGFFCHDLISGFVVSNLTKIRHTRVNCSIDAVSDIHYEPVFEERSISVASNRLDAMIAAACRLSRSDAEKLFQREYVFVNGRSVPRTYSLKEADKVSVRGIGKFKLDSWNGESKKGRIRAVIKWYS